MKTTVCPPEDLGSSELDRWREIRSRHSDLDSPFLSPEFTLAAGRARPEARVAVVEDSEKIVAFFAFERHLLGLGVPIGAGLSDCQAIICEPGIDLHVHELLAQCGLVAWRFDNLVGTQRAMVAPTAVECTSPVIDVSAGFDAYLAHGGRHARTIFQKERKLAREVGPVRFSFGVDDDEALCRLIAWKSEQYRRTGRPDRFARTIDRAAYPGAGEDEYAGPVGDAHDAPCGRPPGGRRVQPALRTTLAGWFPSYDPELSRYSPGAIRTLRTVEAAGLAGLQRYDLGKGAEEYKHAFKTGDLAVCEGWVVRPVVRGYLRRAASMPQELALGVVLRHPRLRRAARVALERIGSGRLNLQRKVRRPVSRT